VPDTFARTVLAASPVAAADSLPRTH